MSSVENTIKIKHLVPEIFKGKSIPVGSCKFPGTTTKIEIPFKDGKFWTGLDKYSPNVTNIADPEARQAKLDSVTELRKQLEAALNINLDQDTKEGREFFANYVINLRASDLEFDMRRPKEVLDRHLLSIYAKYYSNSKIKLDKESAELGDGTGAADFYIENIEQELEKTVSVHKTKHKAISILNDVSNTNPNKLKRGMSYILPTSKMITENTNSDHVYGMACSYLDGNKEYSGTDNITASCETFINFFSQPNDEFEARVLVRKAIRYNILKKDDRGRFYNISTQTPFGRTEEDCVNFTMSVQNQEEIGTGSKKDLPTCLTSQIKKYEKINN